MQIGLPVQIVTPAGGGSGSSIPTITADETLLVPTNYPTITDALDYVRGAVRLNGAIVTIVVESALIPTLNEQIFIEEEYLHYVRLTNDGPVNVSTVGFTNSILGVPAWINIEHSSFGEITGTWAQTAGGPSVGILTIDGDTNTGRLTGATCSITGFFYDVYVNAGSIACVFTTFGSMVMGGGDATMFSCTVNNLFQASNGAFATLAACTINGGAGTAGNLIAYAGAKIVTDTCTLNRGVAGSFLYATSGAKITSQGCTFNITAGAPSFADALTASNVAISGAVIVGASAGGRYTVNGGGILQSTYAGAAFAGGDSQALLAVLATGMIIA